MKKILFFLAILLISIETFSQAPVNPIPYYSPIQFKIKTPPATYTSYINTTFTDSMNIGYGATDFFYLRNTGSAIVLNDNNSNKVGIGATNPLTKLHVFSTSTTRPRGITNSQHSAGADGANFNLYKSRGNPGTPLVITANDTLGSIMWRGYDGGQYYPSARIDVLGTGTIAPSRIGGTMIFKTTTDAVLGNPTEAMRITNAQKIGIGKTNPSATLDVVGDIASTTTIVATTSVSGGSTVISANTINGALFTGLQNIGSSRSNGAGNTLNIFAQSPVASGVNLSGGNLLLKSGVSTGNSFNYIALQTPARNNVTANSDNTLYTRMLLSSTERLTTNVYDTLFSVTIGSDSAWTGIVGYGLQINDNDTIETETGLYYIHIYRGAADAGVIAISSSSQTINGVGATIGGALLFTGTILNGNAGVVYVTIRYRSYLTGIIAGGMKLNFNLLNSSGMGSAITLY